MLWDYRVETLGGTPENMRAYLQRAGAEGWELVSFTLTTNNTAQWGQMVGLAIFKRPYAPVPR